VASSDRIDELKKRYDENPRRFFASLANEYRKAGDLEQAISLCQTHLTEQPSNMNGHVVYGQALFEAGRYDEAQVTFEAALTLDPENLIALRHLGDIACTNGANDQARVWYERVLDADPRNDEIIALLENLQAESKRISGESPIVSAESMAPHEAGAAEFRPPQVSTPLSNTPVSSLTPIVPIDAVDTLQAPVDSALPVAPPMIPPRASLESIGLMDLSIDFDSALGTPPSPAPATPEALSDLMADPFAEPTTPEFQAWEPPVVDLAPSANEPPVPAAEAVQAPAYDESIDMLLGDSLPAEPAPPFVTETMAELYLQQGFTAEALDVYRQLSAASPDDEGLKERVRKLERGDRTNVSHEEVPEQAVVAVDDSAPLNARSYFAGLSARRAVQGNGRARATPSPAAPRVSSPAVTVPSVTAAASSGASVTSLDELFAGGTISPEDEHVALAFAQVAGAVEMGAASVKGKPTAPAASELSLDSVFREADARVTGTVPRQSQTLRFDQFFATAGEDSEPPPLSVSSPAGEPGSPAELQQFQSWLTGLKKP
jgi:tetratricopeptide (TPR) repeat protein